MSDTPLFTPFAGREESIELTPELVRRTGLDRWAAEFQLGTAGYRDLENVKDLHDLNIPFNPLTMAVITEASARLHPPGAKIHLGGEVRAWTPEFLNLAGRIYAAHGLEVHYRGERDEDGPVATTPIWMSSFGTFFLELNGGENFTASHSQYFKGGRKPMDGFGMQLLSGAKQIETGVREIVAQAARGGYAIVLASSQSPRLRHDFNVTEDYTRYIRSIIPGEMLEEIATAGRQGFRTLICTEGGSMGRTSRMLFRNLGIQTGDGGPVAYSHFAEQSDYYGIGILEGENHGVDPGKWQVYRHVGAREALLSDAAGVFFLWDPDGDRFNMVTTAPAALARAAGRAGLETEEAGPDRCLVYFKPNQIYFMLLAFRLEYLQARGELDRFGWLLMESFPTSRSLAELASAFGIPVFLTPVGFKYFGEACRELEDQIGRCAGGCELTNVRGERLVLPGEPRILLMAEESGGAAMGGTELLASRTGARHMLALKEKDAFQVGLLAMALAARLHLSGESFAGYYLERLNRYRIQSRFYERRDVTLFDESLQGEARRKAKEAGLQKRDRMVAFFRRLAEENAAGRLNTGEVTRILQQQIGSHYTMPAVREIFWAGDGTFLSLEHGRWFQLRASGTDAVLRFYAEGRTGDETARLNQALAGLNPEEPKES